MEPQVLTASAPSSTARRPVRQRLVASQSTYQDLALSLALLPGAPTAPAELAASAVLRFNGLATEEEGYLASIARRGEDAHVRGLAAEVAGLLGRLAREFQAGGGSETNALVEELDRNERELGRGSRAYSQTLQVRNASLQDLRGVPPGLPARSALLAVREYRPMDFEAAGRLGYSRWAGVLMTAEGDIQVRNLGGVAEGTKTVQSLLQTASGSEAEAEAGSGRGGCGALYSAAEPFAAELAGVDHPSRKGAWFTRCGVTAYVCAVSPSARYLA